jgi:hypothetical protein
MSRKHIGHMRHGLAGNPNDVTALISDTDEDHCALAIAAAHSAIVAVLLGLPSLKSTVSGSYPSTPQDSQSGRGLHQPPRSRAGIAMKSSA